MSNEPQLPPRQLSKRPQTARFVLSVDGQAKSSYDTREAAEAAAKRISDKFPVPTVTVTDTEQDSVRNLGPTQAPKEPDEAAEPEAG